MFFILQETRSTVVQISHPHSHSCMQRTVVSSGSQLLLSNSLLFCFKSANEFILEICKAGHLKKKRLSQSEIILHNSHFFIQSMFNMRLWLENHQWNVRVFIIKQIMKPFLRRKYLGLQTIKFWRLGYTAFEMQLSHSVWSPPFQSSHGDCAKTVPKD